MQFILCYLRKISIKIPASAASCFIIADKTALIHFGLGLQLQRAQLTIWSKFKVIGSCYAGRCLR